MGFVVGRLRGVLDVDFADATRLGENGTSFFADTLGGEAGGEELSNCFPLAVDVVAGPVAAAPARVFLVLAGGATLIAVPFLIVRPLGGSAGGGAVACT